MFSDAELLDGIRAGQREAFEGLYEKHKTAIFKTALAVTGDRQTAEEVLQDTFLRAFAHADSVDPSAPLSPWLHRIALNLSANRLARKRLLIVPLDAIANYFFADSSSSPEELAERNELRQAVQRAVAELDFKHKAVIVLFYLQDFSLNQIAYILDCPVGTVKSRLHYGCKILRQRLGAEHRPAAEAVHGLPISS